MAIEAAAAATISKTLKKIKFHYYEMECIVIGKLKLSTLNYMCASV